MPTIKPFCALKPATHLVRDVVSRPLEYYGSGEARLIASENACSFLHLISPGLDNPYLKGNRQDLIYKKVIENFEYFLDQNILVKEQKPAIYIYRVQHNDLIQTGLWTLTNIDDYTKNVIKKHEFTVERREAALADYLQQTRIDANPVLITYYPNQEINAIIKKYTSNKAALDFDFHDGTKHQIWDIDKENDIQTIVDIFEKMPHVYIADGHHRSASIARMHRHKQIHNKNISTYFSSVYMDINEVKVLEYNRLVKDLNGYDNALFLHKLKDCFNVEKVDDAFVPNALHQFSMCLSNGWYKLTVKENVLKENDPVAILDVSILHDYILNPILNITDPRTDARLSFVGGKTNLPNLQEKVINGLNAVAFVLYPTSVQQIIDVAQADKTMPPKSTYVEPKFLVGLLTNYIS